MVRVRKYSTNSVNSVDKKGGIDVDLKQHTKVFPYTDISDTIDQLQQFEKERENCTKLRLILTIKPYCSNILFNTVTEIVQNEGTDDKDKLKIASAERFKDEISVNKDTTAEEDKYTILGEERPTSTDMIRDTEYSNGEMPFEYHCGYDIFNNHILRNVSFKQINCLNGKSKEEEINGIKKPVYNTIRDYQRYEDGNYIKLRRRTDYKTIQTNKTEKRLYLKEDILCFVDSINANLIEQNGWFGFNNKSNITTRKFEDKDKKWNDLKISKVFNTNESLSCNFVEMYPDSSLYSFTPKYNKFQNREEDNWDICLTYPYENDYSKLLVNGEHKIITKAESDLTAEDVGRGFLFTDVSWHKAISVHVSYDNGRTWKESKKGEIGLVYTVVRVDVSKDKIAYYYGAIKGQEERRDINFNALLLAEYKQSETKYTEKCIQFRSYVKHNLKKGDTIKLFYSKNKKTDFFEISNQVFSVGSIGDFSNKNKDYYFTIYGIDYLLELMNIEKLTNDYYFRFVKVSNGSDCKYYYRKFYKLPNFRLKKEELTDEDVENRKLLEEYIIKNCSVNYTDCNGNEQRKMLGFDKEQYPLAFSNTIYHDGVSQIVFTDSIEFDKLTDNLGRPISEIYVTIIKRNQGHDLWYKRNKSDSEMKEIEYSHCFGNVCSGLNIHTEKADNNALKKDRLEVGDVTQLSNEKEDYILNNDITNLATEKFYGDVVELNQAKVEETVLGDVYFRFNTEQREHIFNKNDVENNKTKELNCFKLLYDEIESDDFDYSQEITNGNSGFVCKEYDITGDNYEDDKTTDPSLLITYRPEGYCYKAHYPIQIREFSTLRQGSHKQIKVSSCNPRQANGLFIEVVSSLRSGVTSGSTVYLCDSETEEILNKLTVNSVQSSVRFLLNPIERGEENYKNIYSVIEGLLHSDEKKFSIGEEWVDEDGVSHRAQEETTAFDYSHPKYILRLKNIDIPNYAYSLGGNIYLWRDVLKIGDSNTETLKEHPFANGHFYINKEINFFLRRQDPFGYNGLYDTNKAIADIYGNSKSESIYEYIGEEDSNVC